MFYLLLFERRHEVDGCARLLPSLLQSLLDQLDFARPPGLIDPGMQRTVHPLPRARNRLESDGEPPAKGARGRLRQIPENLLGNSLRHTDPDGFTRVAT